MSWQHYTQLSYEERVLIEDWVKDTNPNKRSLSQFARHLGRSPSTISRELSRNGRPPTTNKTRVNKPRRNGHSARYKAEAERYILATERYWMRRHLFLQQSRIQYTARAAEKAALVRVKHPGLKLEQPENTELLQFIITALDSRWSPEQIAGRIKLEGELPEISHESIYGFIRRHKALKDLDLTSCLRRKGKKYHRQKKISYNETIGRKSIDTRPAIVSELIRYGDLEGDTIFGKDKVDRLLTHNDRKSGKVAIGRVLSFNAEKISRQTILDTRRVFGEGVHTVTYDNGVDFSLWYRTERQISASIYFAHAYHSWERGRNENTNGLIRDFLPKGTDFKCTSISDIMTIESLLNNRPRKRLGWCTPNEVWDEAHASSQHSANVALGG